MALNMAAENSKPPKRLSELLQERQEPFVLEVYLSERGCLKKSTRGIARYAKVLKMIRKKIVSINGRLKNSGNFDMSRNNAEIADGDQFSSASSTTVYNSCSESDPEDGITYSLKKDDSLKIVIEDVLNSSKEEEATSDHRIRTSVDELSPVSVLEQTSRQGLYHKQQDNLTKGSGRVSEELILSASHQCLKSERVLPRTKQLLLDFVKEMIATQEKKTGKQMLGSEELGNIICQKVKSCGKESSVSKLVDIVDFEQQKSEIGIEIANAIFEEMVHEIAIDR